MDHELVSMCHRFSVAMNCDATYLFISKVILFQQLESAMKKIALVLTSDRHRPITFIQLLQDLFNIKSR